MSDIIFTKIKLPNNDIGIVRDNRLDDLDGILTGDGNGTISGVPTVSTPSSSNKILTQTQMGQYKRSTYSTSSTSTTITTNYLYDYSPSYSMSSASWTLGTPDTNGTNEWMVNFTAGSSFSLTVTPPSGYTLKWKGGIPTFTSGKRYELSFLQHQNYIVGMYAEIDI